MRLDEIRKLIEAATPGPWAYRIFEVDPITCIIRRDNAYPGESVADNTNLADAEFIAAARTLLPALLAVAEKAEALLEDEGMRSVNSGGLCEALAALEGLKLP